MEFKIDKDNTGEILNAVEQAKQRALEIIGGKIEKYAKALCPVSPGGGGLRNSITHIVQDDEVSVGSNVKYAPYVELGTGKHYTPPPAWMENNAPKGKGRPEPFWYKDEEGNWHMGFYIKAQPYLRPAVENHISDFEDVIKGEMKNA